MISTKKLRKILAISEANQISTYPFFFIVQKLSNYSSVADKYFSGSLSINKSIYSNLKILKDFPVKFPLKLYLCNSIVETATFLEISKKNNLYKILLIKYKHFLYLNLDLNLNYLLKYKTISYILKSFFKSVILHKLIS